MIFSCKGRMKEEIDDIVEKTCACKNKNGKELESCRRSIEKEAEKLDASIQELPEDEKKEMEEYVSLKMQEGE
jgi:hypothetical protein